MLVYMLGIMKLVESGLKKNNNNKGAIMGSHDSCLCWRHFLGATPHDLTAKEFTERRFPPLSLLWNHNVNVMVFRAKDLCLQKQTQCKWKNGGLCTCAEGLRPILAEAASLKIIFIYGVAFNS